MGKREDALACFARGFSCAQSVLSVWSDELGLDQETALRVAGAFGGGIAGTGETCGAVTGGLMAIGLRYGMTDPQKPEAKQRTRDIGRRFLERFTSAFGTCKCRDLLGCDIATQEGAEKARTDNLFKTLCPGFVGEAVEILGPLL